MSFLSFKCLFSDRKKEREEKVLSLLKKGGAQVCHSKNNERKIRDKFDLLSYYVFWYE